MIISADCSIQRHGMHVIGSPVWEKLQDYYKKNKFMTLEERFAKDGDRFSHFSYEWESFLFDFSKQQIDGDLIYLFHELIESMDLSASITAQFRGDQINTTEGRSVLHTALRSSETHLQLDATDIMPLIRDVQSRMKKISDDLNAKKYVGYSGKIIKDIVNIGIGGSDLGPLMAVKALKAYRGKLNSHFVSNICPSAMKDVLEKCDPETTLFIIASKTFQTLETVANAKTAKEWLVAHYKTCDAFTKQSIAVTAHEEYAIEFGVSKENCLPLWDFVGGRFSIWSAIGLSLAISIGWDNFISFLRGAEKMDEHFKNEPLSIPTMMALIGVMNIHFYDCANLAILPYHQHLESLPAYLQQLEMESNGKRVTKSGEYCHYQTAPVIWGALGTNGQHAFHQLLMQGTHTIPVDFIVARRSHIEEDQEKQDCLYANCIAQSQALMLGLIDNDTPDHKVIPGNCSSTTIAFDLLTPEVLGSLIALYEHKVFVQSCVWDVNAYDQWGVELGKNLASNILPALQTHSEIDSDQSTKGLIDWYLK